MSSEQNLVLTTEAREGANVIHISGELDLSTVGALDAELEPLTARTVIVLTDCTFIDSSALRSIVRAERAARNAGHEFALAAPSHPVRRVLEVAVLDLVIPVFPTLDEAITSLS